MYQPYQCDVIVMPNGVAYIRESQPFFLCHSMCYTGKHEDLCQSNQQSNSQTSKPCEPGHETPGASARQISSA